MERRRTPQRLSLDPFFFTTLGHSLPKEKEEVAKERGSTEGGREST